MVFEITGDEMMNIYGKLAKMKCEFQEKPLRKTGHNKFAGFKYFKLEDIMPIINALMDKHGLCGVISFDKEYATLTVINVDEPTETIVITSPMADANTKNSTPIQALGSTQTYLRRYLYLALLDIVEDDELDATIGKEEMKPSNKTKTNAKVVKVEKLLATKEVDTASVMQFVKSTFKVSDLSKLNEQQADSLISMLSAKPDKNA